MKYTLTLFCLLFLASSSFGDNTKSHICACDLDIENYTPVERGSGFSALDKQKWNQFYQGIALANTIIFKNVADLENTKRPKNGIQDFLVEKASNLNIPDNQHHLFLGKQKQDSTYVIGDHQDDNLFKAQVYTIACLYVNQFNIPQVITNAEFNDKVAELKQEIESKTNSITLLKQLSFGIVAVLLAVLALLLWQLFGTKGPKKVKTTPTKTVKQEETKKTQSSSVARPHNTNRQQSSSSAKGKGGGGKKSKGRKNRGKQSTNRQNANVQSTPPPAEPKAPPQNIDPIVEPEKESLEEIVSALLDKKLEGFNQEITSKISDLDASIFNTVNKVIQAAFEGQNKKQVPSPTTKFTPPAKKNPSNKNKAEPAVVIMAAMPNQQGYFHATQKAYKPGTSVFEIHLKNENDKEGTFVITKNSDAYDSLFEYVDDLRGAIKLLGSDNRPKGSNFRQTAGKVEFDGEYWKITEKMKLNW